MMLMAQKAQDSSATADQRRRSRSRIQFVRYSSQASYWRLRFHGTVGQSPFSIIFADDVYVYVVRQ